MVLNRRTYKWFYDHIHSRYYNLLMKWCFLPFGGETKCREELITRVDFLPRDRILDMCCGTGGSTCTISTKAGTESQIIGMDLSFGQVGVATRRPELSHVQFMEGDAAHAPFQDHSFDKVFITHALHEMPRGVRLQVLAEARRILKDQGTLIVLELDVPENLLVRLFIGLWFFYWLPLNFETSTRKDMLRRGVSEEVGEAGFKHVTKKSVYRGVFQTVQGIPS